MDAVQFGLEVFGQGAEEGVVGDRPFLQAAGEADVSQRGSRRVGCPRRRGDYGEDGEQ